MGTAILTAGKLCAGYGKKIIVDSLSFEVMNGEILTIIGANGAGKSTVLKTIASQLPLIDGNVLIGSRNIADMSAHDIAVRLSVCLTERISPERMTCGDVVSTGRYPYTGKLGILSAEDREIVREAMELTGIYHLFDTDIQHISDGQRQTVMLARAIAQQPEVLILDEPTSFLDINNKLRLLSILKELARSRGIAVVQTLHELDLAQRFSDKILCIKGNRADRIAPPEEIFSGTYISELYGITSGTFLPAFAVAEAPGIQGIPEVFVIGGGGSGIPVYRRLQRQGIPFAAGIIHENDIECPVAESLASVVIKEKAFEPVSDKNIAAALKVMQSCKKAVCYLDTFGTMNAGNKILLEKAREMNILTADI